VSGTEEKWEYFHVYRSYYNKCRKTKKIGFAAPTRLSVFGSAGSFALESWMSRAYDPAVKALFVQSSYIHRNKLVKKRENTTFYEKNEKIFEGRVDIEGKM